MKRHWRYLIARWGAHPAIWVPGGRGYHALLPSTDKERDRAMQKSGWTELGRYVRATDPFHRPITIHPSDSARNTVQDASVLDFDMLQTGTATAPAFHTWKTG